MLSSIFKSYDIRGLSPGEIDQTTARRLGKVLSLIYQPKSVMLGRDMRTTSPELEDALVDGFVSSGVHVTRIGLCSTPVFNVNVGLAGGRYDLGVMVTASHNPAAYNGFKLVKSDCSPIGEDSGMAEIRERMLDESPLPDATERGSVTDDDGALERYANLIFSKASLSGSFTDWRIAADAGNGMNGIVLPKITKRLPGVEFTKLYWDLDGTFPNHEANPLKSETLLKLRETVKRDACVFGVAFDGDGDRVGFMDEKGEQIPGDILTALLAGELLRDHPGALVLYDLRSSWSVPEAIRRAGGKPKMCRVGHAHIKRQMKVEGAIFAGELSMHFYFADLWCVESGDLALLLMLKILQREQKPLSEIWKPLRPYFHSGELNFKVSDQAAVLSRLRAEYQTQAADVSELDGLRLEFRSPTDPSNDWWFNVRASNTEPLLRLNLEARTVETLEKKKNELMQLLKND